MNSIMTFSDSYVSFTTMNKESVLIAFIKKHYLADHCEYFFDIMFNCVDKSARFYAAKSTSNLINKAFKIWGICSEDEKTKDHPRVLELYKVIDEFMTLVLYKIHEKDCQKQWSKLENYFTLLEEIGTAGRYQTAYFLQKLDFVTDICDVMMGN